MLGDLEGAVRRGRGGKKKVWTECVQNHIRAFGIAGGREATALKAKVLVETVTVNKRRFVAAWRKGEVDEASLDRRRKRQRGWVSCDRTQERRTCEVTPFRLVKESNESFTDAKRTEN